MRAPSPSAVPPGAPGVVVEPPPPGVASGRWTVSKTTLSVAGALIIVAGAAYVVARIARARR
ncbi:MAG: hypothetical protein IT374_00610 [Polyangiaceae bacterium]|nr:hypothetical protein [Polyangiaceae bacterium]